MIARIVRSQDFERVLRTRSRVSSSHFSIHHVADRPSVSVKPVFGKLITGPAQAVHRLVDEPARVAPNAIPPGAVWLGAVVPKRHARRSVTRTLLKRQIRSVVGLYAATLAGGLWVIRLRGTFDRTRFISAASDELRRAVHEELDSLIASVAQRVPVGA